MWFSYPDNPGNFIPVPIDRVKEIIELNAKNEIPTELTTFKDVVIVEKKLDYENVVGQDSITRFDNTKKKKKSGNQKRRNNNNKRANAPQAKTN